MRAPYTRLVSAALSTVAIFLASSNNALAVPSFARQTGMACEACHTVFPELTPFGRAFKLNGYLIDNLPQVKEVTAEKKESLLLNWLPPLSVQFVASYTKFKTALPDTYNGSTGDLGTGGTGPSQNGTVQFPEAFSLFYAGRIAPQLGGFIQLTYDNNSDSIGWDNTDIRFADLTTLGQDKPLTWGVSANNSPSVQDPWNSLPAWQYPFSQTSSLAVPPITTTQLEGIGNSTVAGLTAYGYWNNLVYLELGGYAAAPHGINNTPLNSSFPGEVVHGVSPYWRVAVQPQWDRHSLAVGLVGFSDQVVPSGANVTTGSPLDKFRDTGLDAQYQYIGDDHIFSAQARYIYEKQTLNATAAANPGLDPDNTLKSLRIGGSYFYQRQLGGSVAYFSTMGDTNPTLYATSTGSPNTNGWAFEADYLPWQNVKLAIQYILYTKFDGSSGSTSYTVAPTVSRTASDNNTLYIFAWIAF
jgi:hypothetical protein